MRMICLLLLFATPAFGGAWDDSSPRVKQWFRSLKIPDDPTHLASCCGEGNAVEADDYEVQGDQYVAVVTDGHGWIPEGTRIPIPNNKRNVETWNPPGHGIVFLDSARNPICYVSPSGG